MTIQNQSQTHVVEKFDTRVVSIFLNGNRCEVLKNSSLYTLVQQEKLTEKRVVIAINNQIIPHQQWQQKLLLDGDNISIFQAIAGG
jgi:sulfur carrier protein